MKFIFTILLGIIYSLNLFAQPSTITYQGKLLDVNGIPVNQNAVAMTFAIYDAASAGTKVWPATGTVSKSVNVVAGLYSVTLGTGSGNDDVFTVTNLSGAALYLEVSVAGNPLPRTLLTTVPYAVVANQSSGVSKNNDITIQATANDGDITLSPNGTGKVIVSNALQFNVGSSLSGKVLTSDASGNASWQTASGGGSPSGAAGGDLTSTYPNPTIASSAVTSAKISDGTIVDGDISPTAAIAYSKLSLTNSISNSDIVANAITTSKVANGTVTTSKLADSAVSGLKLLTYAVNTNHITNGSVTLPKISTSGASSGNVISYNGTNVVWTNPSSGSGLSAYLSNSNDAGSVIAVVLGGTNIPFPTANVTASNITVDGTNTQFTLSSSGKYQITYELRTTSNVLVSTRILVNGSQVTSSAISPSVSSNDFSRTTILSLTAGDVISAQFYGILGAVTLLNPGGASLNIIKIAD